MIAADAERFGQVLATVAEFYDRKLSDGLIVMFFRALEEFEIETVEHAFNRFLASSDSKMFPRPAQILDIIRGSDAERDALAWLTLDAAVRKIGLYPSVIVEDPALAQAIKMTFGEWWQACQVRYNDPIGWNARRRDFAAMYAIARRQATGTGPVLLHGQCDRENGVTGWYPKRTVYGAILRDGKAESRYLAVDVRTGLPAASLREALALPEPAQALAALPEHREEAPPKTRAEFEAELKAYAARREMPKSKRGTETDRQLFESDAARRDRLDELRQQARVIHADRTDETAGTVHVAPDGETVGRHDRDPDLSGRSPETGDGTSLRKGDRPELARGSGVAGVSDPVRDRRRRVRERDSLRAGKLEESQRRKGRTRTVGTGKTRRKT